MPCSIEGHARAGARHWFLEGGGCSERSGGVCTPSVELAACRPLPPCSPWLRCRLPRHNIFFFFQLSVSNICCFGRWTWCQPFCACAAACVCSCLTVRDLFCFSIVVSPVILPEAKSQAIPWTRLNGLKCTNCTMWLTYLCSISCCVCETCETCDHVTSMLLCSTQPHDTTCAPPPCEESPHFPSTPTLPSHHRTPHLTTAPTTCQSPYPPPPPIPVLLAIFLPSPPQHQQHPACPHFLIPCPLLPLQLYIPHSVPSRSKGH